MAGLRTRLFASVALGAVALTVCGVAHAQQVGSSSAPSASAQLEELVVTASRREERLQDVGMAVSAYSGEQMAKLNVTSGKDLVRLTPGLSLAAPSGDTGSVTFTVRGVGLNDYGVGNEPPVAIYSDDVYQASISSATALTFDLDRVEVLRGPQGTLFGRNATGGLIHFISVRPQPEAGGYLDARGGSYGYSAEGALNLPLTSDLATRLSLSSEHVDGWMKNAFGKNGNNANKNAARFQVRYDNGSFSGLLILRGNVAHARPQYTFQASDPGPAGLGVPVDKPANEALGVGPSPTFRPLDDGHPYTGAVNEPGHTWRKNYGSTARLEWRLNGVDLVSITSATRTTNRYIEDTDMSPVQLYEIPSDSKATQYSQEFRAARQAERLGWVAGVYFFRNELTNPRAFNLYPFAVSYASRMAQRVTSAAVFGEGNYKLTDAVTLVAGLRWTEETRKIDFAQDLLIDVDGTGFGSPTNERQPILRFGPASVGGLSKRSDGNLSGRLRLEWRPNADVLLYGAINRGFKSGGFNNPLTADNLRPGQMAYRPERLDSYEVGAKTELFGHRARLNVDAFYYDYRDFQSFQTDGLSTFLSNIDADIYGLDVEFVGRLTDELTVSGGAELLHTQGHGIILPSGRVADRTLANAPRGAATLALNYQREMLGGSLSADLSGRYVGPQFYDISNAPVTREPAYTIADARVGYLIGTRGPELFVSATNLFDKAYRLYVVDASSLGFSQTMYAQPRRISFGARVRF